MIRDERGTQATAGRLLAAGTLSAALAALAAFAVDLGDQCASKRCRGGW